MTAGRRMMTGGETVGVKACSESDTLAARTAAVTGPRRNRDRGRGKSPTHRHDDEHGRQERPDQSLLNRQPAAAAEIQSE